MSAPAMSVAPNMASANPGGHMMPFPNMSKESLDQMFKKFQQMKQDGSSETDPDEFTRLRGILTSAKHYSDMQKQRQQFQKHQQLMQNGTPNQPAPNGFRLPQSSPENLPPNLQTASALGPPSDQSQYPTKAQNTQMGARSAFSEDQIKMLRSQMMAFKLLSKDAPLPPDVQKAVFRSQQAEASPTPSQALASMGQAIENGQAQLRPDHDGTSSPLAPARTYKTFTSPQTYLQPRLGYDHYSRRRHRPIIPSLMPPGIDIDRAREERENIVYNRIVARKAELEKLNASLASWDTSKSDTPMPDTSIKLKALIEYKMLTLLPKQRALRQSISREMVQADNLAMTANRSLYRRQKKQSLREARITERIEKQQREARVSKEKKKHDDYLHSIAYHKEEMHRAAKEQRARTNRLGRLMITQHQIIEKEEQKRVERTAKQRLQALKANDEETYLKLLGQAKDSRISHLLKQTDGFLTQLAASVKDQQRSAVQKWGNKGATPELPEEDEEIAGSDDEVGGKKVDYYEVAHRVKESIHQQSSNLIGGELKEYQLKGLQWMISLYNNNLNGILADEMGLGKTIQTISFITYLIEKKNQNGPFLVIVPLSTLTNWNNEFEKWAPSVKRIVYKGPPQSRKQCAAQMKMGTFQVVLTTYEFIIKDRPVLSKVKWLHMTVDEGHRMKNSQSKLSFTITNYYSTRFRLILTGTPLQNNLPELWALLNFVLPNIFKSVKSFDEWFNTPFANTGGQDKMDLTEEEQILVIRRLHKVLRPFLLRRLKKDVEKDLPDKQERVIKCSFSALQTKLYRQLVNHNRLMVSDGKGGKTGLRGLSNMLMQLRKLCNHPFVFEEVEDQVNPHRASNDLLWRTAGKFELLDRILPKFRATGHRVLMFFQMTQIMNIMEDFMRLRQFSYLRLDGSTKSDERAGLLKEFNREDSPHFVFLLSTRAGGLGLNLQAADTVIIFDSDWNPHQDLQAQDRAHRIGQRNEVRILRLISSNSVEEKILERAQFKLDMDGKVIQAGKFDNKSTNEERDAMLRVMLESAEAAEELETEEMGDEDLNMLMVRNEGELEIFQEFDAERARHPLYGAGKKFPRLMGESELPDIYVSEDVPEAEPDADEFNFGRGARERTRVKYDDGLTEEQWLDAVDNDEDSIENAIARKQEKKQRRAANKEKRLRLENGDLADTPPPPDDDSGSPVPRSKRRGRKPGPRTKRTADDASLDSESVAAPAPPPRKRGRQAKPVETLNPDERDAMQSILDRIYESLNDMEATSQNDDGDWVARGVTDAFLELPSKALYPDYYHYITQPIAMEKIKDRINRKEYQGLDGFAADIRLMCSNCRTYNEDASSLWHDANLIETKTTDLLSQESAANSSLGRAAYTGPKTEGNSTLAPSTNSNSHQASATPGATNGLANGVAGSFGSGSSGDEGRPMDIDARALGSNSGEGAQTQPGGTPKLKLNFGGGGAANATTNGA